jgi:hypothetical protein
VGGLPEAEQVRAQALEVAAGWSPPDAPESWQLTAALFEAISEHDALVAALASLPADRLAALLASAAITFLVRRDRPVPLARYWPDPGSPQPAFDPGFHPAAAAFISERLDDVLALCTVRRYQMNEVARCAQIATGIGAIAGPGGLSPSPAGQVFALVDLGTGAGLGLHLDRYRYLVGTRAAGPADASLTLSCAQRGASMPPPASLPLIGPRTGIDVAPIDLSDPAALAWLEACAPPEAATLSRLSAAVEVARRHPAPVVAGDLVDVLPDVLARIPARHPVLVVDAYASVFLPPDRLAGLIAVLADTGRVRPVTWLSLDPLVPLGPEGRESVQGLELPASLARDYQQHGVFAVLGAVTFGPGWRRERLLARAHPSGQWIEWLDR